MPTVFPVNSIANQKAEWNRWTAKISEISELQWLTVDENMHKGTTADHGALEWNDLKNLANRVSLLETAGDARATRWHPLQPLGSGPILQIQEVHLVPHSNAQFLSIFIKFSYLYVGHLSLLRLQTKTIRWSNYSFCSFRSYNPETFMSSAVSDFVQAVHKYSLIVPREKRATFWFPWTNSNDNNMSLYWDLTIQQFQSYMTLKIVYINQVFFLLKNSRVYLESLLEWIAVGICQLVVGGFQLEKP